MKDRDCVEFLQWALPQMSMRWRGFRKVRKQVCKRLDRRLRELELPDVWAYRDYLQTHPAEWPVLDRFCRISISRFYRDRGVFDVLRSEVLPMLAAIVKSSGDDSLRCWSAGCASGEEPYTLSIAWHEHIAGRFFEITFQVIATDSDANMLDRARRGCYGRSSLKDLPDVWISAAFTCRDVQFCIKPVFRAQVEFRRQDIRHDMPAGQFHLVLCRHLVFTYFDEPLQRKMLDQLISKLMPGGILVTGKQESLPHLPDSLEEFGRSMGVYRYAGQG